MKRRFAKIALLSFELAVKPHSNRIRKSKKDCIMAFVGSRGVLSLLYDELK
jgi:hypothetical protein